MDVQDLGNLLGVALDLERAETGGQTGAVAEKTDSLALKAGRVDVRHQAGQTTPDTTTVHVSAHGGNLDGRVDTLLETLLGEGHEGLLHNLVSQRLLVVHIPDFWGHLGESRAVWVGQKVVVQKTSIRLLHQFAGWCVESQVVKSIQRGLDGPVSDAVAIGMAICHAILQLLLLLTVGAVGSVQGFGVAVNGVVAVNVGVFAGEIGLVEIVSVLHVGPTQAWLDNNRRIRADEQSNAASSASGAGVALGVQGNVTSNDDTVASVPRRGLDPVDSVEEGVGASVAGVDRIHALDVGVVAEKLHQDGLDGLGLIQEGLRADFQAANRVGVDFVLLEEVGNSGQGKGVDV